MVLVRQRDLNDELSRKNGSVRIAALRHVYGASFAPGVDGRKTLSEVIGSLDQPSLEKRARDNVADGHRSRAVAVIFMGYLPVIAALCGAVVGAILTSILGRFAVSRRELRQSRMKVLVVLMGGRGRIFSQEVSDHINVIPILFYSDTKGAPSLSAFLGRPKRPSHRPTTTLS